MIRSLVRNGGRRLLGPALFDSVVQFRRLPLSTSLLEEAKHTRCVFVEPHFDDVVFSCGGVFASLARMCPKLDLVTAFTAIPDPGAPLSPLARKIHAEWKAVGRPYEQRRQEGKRIEHHLPACLTWLEIEEALYRNEELVTFEQLMQQGDPPNDDPTYRLMQTRLRNLLAGEESTTLFAPLGVGGHPDHLVVHAAVRALAKQRPDWTVWYYEDFPYVLGRRAVKARVWALDEPLRPVYVNVNETLDLRVQLAANYESQVASIFGTPERMRDEIVGYAGRVGTPERLCERLWGSAE